MKKNIVKYRHYFTFPELMVVLMVMLVALILFTGAIRKAVHDAKAQKCASIQKQLQQAWLQYTNDYKYGCYSLCDYKPGWQNFYWRYSLSSYLQLPSWKDNVKFSKAKFNKAWSKYLCPMKGPFNSQMIGINIGIAPTNRKETPPMLSDFVKPSQTVVFADSKGDTYTSMWGGSFTYRHDNMRTSNFAFVDGHVERTKTKSEIFFVKEKLGGYPPENFYYKPDAKKPGWPKFKYNDYK